jgi:hypothetical protein
MMNNSYSLALLHETAVPIKAIVAATVNLIVFNEKCEERLIT